MPKLILTTVLWLLALSLFAQNGTEIYLTDLSWADGKPVLKNPKNVTEKTGYDNQPFFDPAKPLLYYTSMMPDTQTDIWAYDLSTGARTQITHTPDSEYSPTVLPNGRYLSCIVQRKGTGDQDLVQYALDNPANTSLILESKKTGKIGYQAWLNPDETIVFVLGEPNTIHYLNRRTGSDTVIARQVGRSLHRIPGQRAFSFVQQVDGKWLIQAYTPATNQLKTIAESHPDSEHYNAWTTDGRLLESRGSEIWFWNTAAGQWQPVTLPASLPQKKISRMAIQGTRLALVLDE